MSDTLELLPTVVTDDRAPSRFTLTPDYKVSQLLAGLPNASKSMITMRITGTETIYEAGAGKRVLRFTAAGGLLAGAPTAFKIEARIAKEIHRQFERPVLAIYSDETLTLIDGDLCLKLSVSPASNTSSDQTAEAGCDDIATEPISSEVSGEDVCAALDFCLPFARNDAKGRSPHGIRFCGNMLVAGDGGSLVTFVQLSKSPLKADFGISRTCAARLRQVLAYFPKALHVTVTDKHVEFGDGNYSIRLPTIDTKLPSAVECLNHLPCAALRMNEREFRYIQDTNSCVLRPNEDSAGKGRLTFNYDVLAKHVLEIRGLSCGHYSKSHARPVVNADADVPAWRSIVDLHSFTKIAVLPASASVDIANLPELTGAVYIGQDNGSLKAHVFLAQV